MFLNNLHPSKTHLLSTSNVFHLCLSLKFLPPPPIQNALTLQGTAKATLHPELLPPALEARYPCWLSPIYMRSAPLSSPTSPHHMLSKPKRTSSQRSHLVRTLCGLDKWTCVSYVGRKLLSGDSGDWRLRNLRSGPKPRRTSQSKPQNGVSAVDVIPLAFKMMHCKKMTLHAY